MPDSNVLLQAIEIARKASKTPRVVPSYVILRRHPPDEGQKGNWKWEVVAVAPRGLEYNFVKWAVEGMGAVVIAPISRLRVFGLSAKQIPKPIRLPRAAYTPAFSSDVLSPLFLDNFRTQLALSMFPSQFQQAAADWLRFKLTGHNDTPMWNEHYIINEPDGARVSIFILMKPPTTDMGRSQCDKLCLLEMIDLNNIWHRAKRQRKHR